MVKTTMRKKENWISWHKDRHILINEPEQRFRKLGYFQLRCQGDLVE